MKNLTVLNQYRIPHRGYMGNGSCGKFIIPTEDGKLNFLIIASAYDGWDHVSVSLITADKSSEVNRCPRWSEMCYVKDLFFEHNEVVVQYHPSKDKYVNNHEYTLHLWRPIDHNLPIPPTYMV